MGGMTSRRLSLAMDEPLRSQTPPIRMGMVLTANSTSGAQVTAPGGTVLVPQLGTTPLVQGQQVMMASDQSGGTSIHA